MKNLSLLVFTFLLSLNLYSQTQYNATTYHQFNRNYGYLQIGAQSTTTTLFNTDRPTITFNKPIFTTGGIISSTGTDNMYLQTGGNTKLTIKTDGKVGIGCDPGIATLKIYKDLLPSFELASPLSRLEIGVATHAWAFAPNSQIGDVIFRPLGMVNNHHGMILCLPNDQNDGLSYIKFGDEKNGLWVSIFNDRNFRIDGTLYATKIYVKTNVWSDYVFDPDYKLKSLEEIETFINENKHLPDVPSAKEVIDSGIDVADMNAILLRKVEELTLLMIEQNKTIQELQGRLDKLQK